LDERVELLEDGLSGTAVRLFGAICEIKFWKNKAASPKSEPMSR